MAAEGREEAREEEETDLEMGSEVEDFDFAEVALISLRT